MTLDLMGKAGDVPPASAVEVKEIISKASN